MARFSSNPSFRMALAIAMEVMRQTPVRWSESPDPDPDLSLPDTHTNEHTRSPHTSRQHAEIIYSVEDRRLHVGGKRRVLRWMERHRCS